jgi:hypothetical protein
MLAVRTLTLPFFVGLAPLLFAGWKIICCADSSEILTRPSPGCPSTLLGVCKIRAKVKGQANREHDVSEQASKRCIAHQHPTTRGRDNQPEVQAEDHPHPNHGHAAECARSPTDLVRLRGLDLTLLCRLGDFLCRRDRRRLLVFSTGLRILVRVAALLGLLGSGCRLTVAAAADADADTCASALPITDVAVAAAAVE